jgi:hypothetical protein
MTLPNNSDAGPFAACAIGKIVKSNTHIDYVCQVYNPGEVAEWPQPADYSFGTFVALALGDELPPTNGGPPAGGRLIGIIYNTLLLNPDFGSLGPRLSPRQELEIFTPDYLAETATLVGIIAVGWEDEQGICRQGVPPLAATVNDRVYPLDDSDLARFHDDGNGRVTLRYAPVLLGQNNPLVPPLLINVADRLTELFPSQRDRLAVVRNNLAWKNIVQPAG